MRVPKNITVRRLAAPLLACSLFASASASAMVDCTGTVTNLSINLDNEGAVTLSLSSGPTSVYLCSIDGIRNGVSATVCRTMYATLMAAKISGKGVLIRFLDYNACAAVPSWGNAGTLGWTQLLLD